MEKMYTKKLINTNDELMKRLEISLNKAYKLIDAGVQVRDPHRIEINGELTCGKNVSIGTNVIFNGLVSLGDNVEIEPNCILRDCSIGTLSYIKAFSSIEGSKIGENTFIGPYGRIRPDSTIEDNVEIGNFVEIKGSFISSNCRINHHSFIGDSILEKNVTIGAGTITCNHDGANINNIHIESDVYIGSNCSLVAPLRIQKKSTIGAGSSITKDVPGGSLTIARAKQISIKKWKGPRSKKSSDNLKNK